MACLWLWASLPSLLLVFLSLFTYTKPQGFLLESLTGVSSTDAALLCAKVPWLIPDEDCDLVTSQQLFWAIEYLQSSMTANLRITSKPQTIYTAISRTLPNWPTSIMKTHIKSCLQLRPELKHEDSFMCIAVSIPEFRIYFIYRSMRRLVHFLSDFFCNKAAEPLILCSTFL